MIGKPVAEIGWNEYVNSDYFLPAQDLEQCRLEKHRSAPCHADFDDELSSMALDRYVRSLDRNRSYFLQSDLQSFERFRHDLDERTIVADVSPAFVIFNTYLRRVDERIDQPKRHQETPITEKTRRENPLARCDTFGSADNR